MENSLARERAASAALFEFAAIAWRSCSDGRWVRVNRALCAIVVYGEELLATTFQAITHPDDLDADMKYARQMLDGRGLTTTWRNDTFIRTGTSSGSFCPSRWCATMQASRCISLPRSRTSRSKDAESQLFDSEFRYGTITNLVPGFVFEGVVRDGRPQPTWVSGGFERVYGCTSIALLKLGGEHFYDAETRTYSCGRTAVAQGSDLSIDVSLRSTGRRATLLRVVGRAVRTGPRAEVDRVLALQRTSRAKAPRRALGEATTRSSSDSARKFTMGWVGSSWPSAPRPGSRRVRAQAPRTETRMNSTGSRCSRAVRSVPSPHCPRPLACERGRMAGWFKRCTTWWTVSMTPTGRLCGLRRSRMHRTACSCRQTDMCTACSGRPGEALKHAGRRTINVTLYVQPDMLSSRSRTMASDYHRPRKSHAASASKSCATGRND